MSEKTKAGSTERFALVRWVDAKFDGYPYATNWLLLILIAPFAVLMLGDWHPIAVTVAILWWIPWVALIIWRFFTWLGRLERRWAKRRKR